jgi:type IV pilus assembly protein PilY1
MKTRKRLSVKRNNPNVILNFLCCRDIMPCMVTSLVLAVIFLMFTPVAVYAADPPCAFDCTVPSSGTVGIAYEFTCAQTGNYTGNPTYDWNVTGRPAGVDILTWLESTYHKSLKYSGTPTTAASYTISTTMTTSGPSKCTSITKTFPVTIYPATSVSIDTTTLPVATESSPYTKDILGSCSGTCTTPYDWTATGLPAWLSLTHSGGLTANLSGTPPLGSAATYSITVTLEDSSGTPFQTSKTFSLIVNAVPAALNISTVGLISGTVGMAYTYTMSGAGGTTPYSWSATGLPAGLSMSTSGLISGTPTTAGTSNVNVTLTDSAGGSDGPDVFPLLINPAATPVSAVMNSYCSAPPFITQDIKPNLLLMIDNSSSMYDLQYADKGTTSRYPYYCYDKTYVSTNPYVGYFETNSIYKYNWTSNKFEISAFPGSCDLKIPASGSASELCLTGSFTTAPKSLTDFYARGNYLNWLTASKFDNLKKILTGGRYDNALGALIAESRGCVGRMFIKEPIQEISYTEGGTNTDLGITFGIRGPNDPVNPTLPSPGGETFIEIYGGNYNEAACQNAIQVYTDPTSGQIDQRTATAPCIGCSDKNCNDPGLPGKVSNAYVQSVQECWQYRKDGTVGVDAVNTVKNQCPDIYDGYSPGKCAKTGTTCAITSECTTLFGAGYTCENNLCVTGSCTTDSCGAGSFCVTGPRAIFPGNPALLCSSNYTGACYVGLAPYSKFNFTGCVGTDCGDDCIIAQHNKYCGDMSVSPVVDPTDDPSATETYDNLPAIIGGASMEGQLGEPLTKYKQIAVRVNAPAAPTGKVQDFKDLIRFGAMTFNYNGSVSECVTDDSDILKCPKNCSNDKNRSCTTAADCAYASPAATCDAVTSSTSPVNNLDAGYIKSYLGDPVGDHNGGLIRTIDIIPAQAWTPYAEAYYEAVAYFTNNTTPSSTRPYRLNTSDFDATKNPVQSLCQSNNVLLITDGMSTADQNSTVRSFVSGNNDGDGNITTSTTTGSVVPKYQGSINIDDIAYYARHTNIFDATKPIKFPKAAVSNYVVYTGIPCPEHGTDPNCGASNETIPEKLMIETAKNGRDPELDIPATPIPNYYLAESPSELATALNEILTGLSKKAASGTAASVLASGEGSGANLVQAVFYPAKTFDTDDIKWIGRLTNLWYYVDPLFGTSGIYEDNSGQSGPPYASPNDYILNLTDDNRVSFAYDPVNKVTNAQRSKDTNGDGVADASISPDIPFENMASLWDAGVELWKRSTARNIKTTIGSSLIDFSIANSATLEKYLQASGPAEANDIINYIHGTGDYGYRLRTVKVDLNKDGDYLDAGETTARVWRLGDIIQSTPRIASRFALNSYDKVYGDTSYATFIGDTSPVSYRDRGMVFTGANDGMLHAFYLGKLELDGTWKTDQYKKAKLDDPLSVGRGKEVWAFIPSSVLPYLKYIADPNYCHIYSVDLSPYIFDASIGAPGSGDISNNTKDVNSWRTILIGGMRLGGACRASDSTCTDCVKAPGVDLDGNGTVSGTAETEFGLSSYFALDITNTLQHPDNPAAYPPELLWEFSRPDLGFSTTGPSVVKINMKTEDNSGPSGTPDGNRDGYDTSDTTKNGKWFVVFGSGPTGPISTSDHQFMGGSDQTLKLFIIDLKDGPGSTWTLTTSETNGFAGSMINSTYDIDADYQDDVVYVPYVKKTGTTWTDGGVGRLLTKEDVDPAHWSWSRVIDGIGPVTSAVAKLQDKRRGQLWLYFGTGRYYFEQETADDREGQNAIYGIKEPCYSLLDPNFNLTSCPSVGSLEDVTDIANVPTTPADIAAMNGWKINLNSCSDSSGTALGTVPSSDCSSSSVAYRTERMITDPLATTLGVVFFTTFKPKDDTCNPGGKSYIWATKYNTGGAAGALLKGKAILQVSTGKIEEVNLAGKFLEEGERRSGGMEGVPPTAQGLSLISSPPPVKRTIHMMER